MAHQRFGKWRQIRKLGEGGQGSVYLAFNEDALNLSLWDFASVHKIHENALLFRDAKHRGRDIAEKEIVVLKDRSELTDALATVADVVMQMELGALKTLKPPEEWTRDPVTAKNRIEREIAILREVQHPHLIRLLDADQSGPWLTTEFHSRGDIKRNQHLYSRKALQALQAVRDLAGAVDMLHRKNMIHRDIKPENIFLANDGRLVLGDLGLTLPTDATSQRLTQSGDNAGTYSWMPPWAMNVRHEFMPTFDIYAIGKILWFLLSDLPASLPVEYRPGDIHRTVTNERHADEVERILTRCVVLRETDCIQTVDELIGELNDAIEAVDLPVAVTPLKVAAHALSRPGPSYLISVDASTRRSRPSTSETVTWKFRHPRAGGRGVMMPGIHAPGDASPQPSIPDDDLWNDFLKQDATTGRWLICQPNPISFECFVQCDFGPISLSDARFFQFSIRTNERSKFKIYLRFSDNRWIGYSGDRETGKHPSEPEYGITVPSLSPSSTMQMILRDIRRDWNETWGRESASLPRVDAIRIRGGFELSFFRIV